MWPNGAATPVVYVAYSTQDNTVVRLLFKVVPYLMGYTYILPVANIILHRPLTVPAPSQLITSAVTFASQTLLMQCFIPSQVSCISHPSSNWIFHVLVPFNQRQAFH